MEHGLEYITFYVKKHMAYLAVCSGPLPVRDQPLGAPAFVTRICLLKPALIYSLCYQIPAYSWIGKVFPAVDMFLFPVKNQKIVQLCIMK